MPAENPALASYAVLDMRSIRNPELELHRRVQTLTHAAIHHGGACLIPGARAVHDFDHGQHHRHFDQHADDGRQRRAPESKPNRLMAAATASSKKLLAPMRAEGAATQWASPPPD